MTKKGAVSETPTGEDDRSTSGSWRGDEVLGRRQEGEGGSTSLDPAGFAQELMFKTLTAGLASLFSTQEALRKAVGDAMPPEWVDFASDQGDRARQELFDRISDQVTALIDSVDLGELLVKTLEDHVVEVNASVRLRPSSGGDESPTYEFSLKPAWRQDDEK